MTLIKEKVIDNTFFEEKHTLNLERIKELQRMIITLPNKEGRSGEAVISNFKNSMNQTKKEILEHFKCEEEVVFPYLQKHIPRLEMFIRFCLAEHAFIKNQIRDLSQQTRYLKLKTAKKTYCHKVEEKLYDLLFDLRNHFQREEVKLYWVLRHELDPYEKKELMKLILEHSFQFF